MSDILSYVYQGEWTENLQTKLNNWFTKQSRFLSEMEFEEKLFRDFITVGVVCSSLVQILNTHCR